jgi:hypothetical protein
MASYLDANLSKKGWDMALRMDFTTNQYIRKI